MRKKNAGIIVSGILFIIASVIWIIIGILQAIYLEGGERWLGLWNFIMAILSVVIGIGIIQHKHWGRSWGMGTSVLNMLSIAYSWYQSSSMFFGFFLALYLVCMVLIIANFRKFEQDEETLLPDKAVDPTQNNNELNLLWESKQKGILTDTEYEQKVLDVKARISAQPFIDKLVELKNGKLLTEPEFEKKRLEIINEKRNAIINEGRADLEKKQAEIEKQKEYKARLATIPNEKIDKLSAQNKARLEKFIEVITPTDIIAFHDNKVKLIDGERWTAINNAGTQEQFEVIYRL